MIMASGQPTRLRPEPKTKSLFVECTPETHELVKARAAAIGLSISEYLYQLVRQDGVPLTGRRLDGKEKVHGR